MVFALENHAGTGSSGRPARTKVMTFDGFQLDLLSQELRYAGAPVRIDPLALRLLGVLLERPGEVVSKQELFTKVWDSRTVSENALAVTMTRLRKTLTDVSGGSGFIATSFRRGYRFTRPVNRSEGEVAQLRGEALDTGVSAGLVGRDRVLNLMRSRLHQADSGRGHALLVCGEPGIGKTSSVEVLAREADAAGFAVTWAYCREHGTTPQLWPFAQLVRGALAKSTLDLGQNRLHAAMRELSRLVPELDPSAPGSGPTPSLAFVDPGARHRMFDAVTRVLLAAASARTCVLILEDLHQADAATLELLRYLIDELTDARLLLLVTVRAPYTGVSPLLALRNCSRLELERLSEPDVVDYVCANSLATADLARAIFVKSRGNPFIMREFMRQLGTDPALDPGALVFSNATLQLARQRLHELSEEVRGVLETAAVIGASFELPLLEVASGLEMSTLLSRLEAVWSTGIIVAARGSHSAFAFDHELLREALYESLAPVSRRSIHLAIARALEQRRQAGVVAPASTFAYHLFAAMPQTDLRACIHYCSMAAEEAGQSFAYADGARYLAQAREALDLLPDGSPRLRLKLMLGQALYARACSSPNQESLLRQLLYQARLQRDPSMFARAALLVDPHPGFPGMSGSRRAIDDALAMLPQSERGLRAALLARSATSAPEAYDTERSAARVASALELIGDADAPFTRYVAGSAQLYLHGGPAERLASARRSSELEAFCLQHPKLYGVPPAWFELHRAITAQQDGDLPAQDAALARCEKIARTVGCRELLWHCQRFQALARFNLGQVELGGSLLRDLHRRARQDQLLGTQLLCAYDKIVVLGGAAAQSYSDVLNLDPGDAPSVWSMKVRALAASGLVHEARVALSRVPAPFLARLPGDRDYLGTLGTLARAAVAVHAPEHAAALYDLLAPYSDRFAAHLGFRCEGSVSQLLGLLAASLGRTVEAGERLSASIELSERAGLRLCAADARRELAALRRR